MLPVIIIIVIKQIMNDDLILFKYPYLIMNDISEPWMFITITILLHFLLLKSLVSILQIITFF